MNKIARISGLVVAITAITYFGFEAVDRNADSSESKVNQEQVVKESTNKEKTDPTPSANLSNSVETFINNWIKENGEMLKPLILDNFDSLTGSYIYAGEVISIEDHVVINTDISDIMVQPNQINSYRDLGQVVEQLEVGDLGVSIVEYKEGSLVGVDFHKVSTGTFAQIQMAILGAEVYNKSDSTDKAESEVVDDYSKSKAKDWKGMALLTAREALNKGLAPIFIVPNSSLTLEKDLNESFYYIIAGNFVSTTEKKTVLSTYQGKNISLDFGINPKGLELKKETPTWVYLLVNEGEIESVEVQQFSGGKFAVMAEGVMDYITTSPREKDQLIHGGK